MPNKIAAATTKKNVKNAAILPSLQELTTSNDISLREFCKGDIAELAKDLRESDVREMWACYHVPPSEALALCVKRSMMIFSLFYKGKISAIGGLDVPDLLGLSACAWLWTGKNVREHPKSFFSISRSIVTYFRQLYPDLYAACDVRYTAAQRYLQHLKARPIGDKFYLVEKETQFQWYRW